MSAQYFNWNIGKCTGKRRQQKGGGNEPDELNERVDGTYIGLARTIYIQCVYGIFSREITKYMVINGVYIRFWPTLTLQLLQ